MIHQYLNDVASLVLGTNKCIGCGRCVEICPHRVFVMEGGKAYIANKNRCIECGACTLNCPASALSVNAGVGCASAIVKSWFNGATVSCDCGGSSCC